MKHFNIVKLSKIALKKIRKNAMFTSMLVLFNRFWNYL